jgi:opacity protein-like surface antigen
VAGVLAAAGALAPMTGARAGESLVAGMKDVGLGGAVSISHDTRQDLDTITGLQLLPHVGLVVSDAMGPAWLRGSLEILLEPTLMRLESEAASATVAGVSANGRWIFSGSGRLRPHLEAGAGVLVGEMDFRQTNCEVNFVLQGGPGLLLALSKTTALTLGYRFQHVSNGGACRFDVGINSSALYVGLSYFFR